MEKAKRSWVRFKIEKGRKEFDFCCRPVQLSASGMADCRRLGRGRCVAGSV
jgi:hypothetical protein